MKKKFLLTLGLLVGVFLVDISQTRAAGCCVYYQGSPGSSSICSAINPTTKSIYTFSDGAQSFSCSGYKKAAKDLGCDNGAIEIDQNTTECLDAGYVVVSQDLVGAYLFSSKITVNGKNLQNSDSCIAVSGYSVQTKSETDPYCQIGRSFLATTDGNGTFNSENFKNDFTIALEAIVGDVSKFTNLLAEASTKYCCIPKVPQKNGCQPPGFKTVGQFTNEQAKEGVKPGTDLLPYFFCENNQVLYPVKCDDGTTQITKPSENYQTPSLYPTAIQYCQLGTDQRICSCDGTTGECKKYVSISATSEVDAISCRISAQKEFGKNGYCKTEPINRPAVCENDPPLDSEYQGTDFEIPDASGFNQIGTVDLKQLIARFIKGLLGVIGSLSLVMFLYGGILLMLDRGNADQTAKAKEIVVWTSLGLAVIFAAYAIVNFIFEAFPK